MFGNDPLEIESLISSERGKDIISLDIFMILVEILVKNLVKKHSLSKSPRKQNWRIKVHSMLNKGKLLRLQESSKI